MDGQGGWWVLAADPKGERFYTADPSGTLSAVDAATGKRLWSVLGAGGLNGGVAEIAVDQDRVYLSQQDEIRALNASTGKQAWSVDLFASVGRPVIAGDVLYVPAERQPLSILEPSTGNVLDAMSPITEVYGHPVIVDGRLYVTNGRLLDTFTL